MRKILIIALLAICFSQPLFARVEWTTAATDVIIGKPAVTSDRAIFASYDGRVYAYSLKTGSIIWTFDAGQLITQGAVLVSPDKASVVTIDGTVYIISAAEGKVLSEIELKQKPLAFSSADNRIYVGYYGGITAISSAGRIVWDYSLNTSIGQIGSGNGRVYFTADRKIYSLSGSSGAERWVEDAEDTFLARPFETGGKVYVGATDGKVYEFDGGSGAPEWAFRTGAWVMSTPLLVGNALFFGANDGYVYSVTKYGQLRFRAPIGGEVWTQPIAYEQNGRTIVVFATTDNKLYGIDSQTGREEWVFQTYGRPEEAALVGKSLVFGTNKGKVYSISTSEMCGFTWPNEMQTVGDWPVEVEGKANVEGEISQVEVRIGNGPWVAAKGKADWFATIDPTDSEPGSISVQCRVRSTEGVADTTEYSTLSLIKSKSAQPLKMYVSAPGETAPMENITVSAQDARGIDLRNVNVTVEGNHKTLDSPFAVVLGRSGPVTISIQKPGFETANLVVVGKGGEMDLLLTILGMIIVAAVAVYFLFGRRFLAGRSAPKR
ncbi:MAG: PQQ-binding-like beta-propeller repeat protein [Candidatus Micrarchaeia archaeon]